MQPPAKIVKNWMLRFSVACTGLGNVSSAADSANQYLPVVYFKGSVYIDELPNALYNPQETPFLPARATFAHTFDRVEEALESVRHDALYMVLSAVQAPKKAKRPVDGVSYAELTLLPNYAFAELRFSDLLERASAGEGVSYAVHTERDPTVTIRADSLSLPCAFPSVPGASAELSLSVEFTYPNPSYHRLHPITLDIDMVRFGGDFSNMKKITPATLPGYNWSLSMQLPGIPNRTFDGFRNGYLVAGDEGAPHPDASDQSTEENSDARYDRDVIPCFDSPKSIMAASVDKFITLAFPEYYTELDSGSIETGLATISYIAQASMADKNQAKNSASGINAALPAALVAALTAAVVRTNIGVAPALLDTSTKADARKGAGAAAAQTKALPTSNDSATEATVTFQDSLSALQQAIQMAYTRGILRYYTSLQKQSMKAEDLPDAAEASKTTGKGTAKPKDSKPSHPSLDPKNQVSDVKITLESSANFLRIPLVHERQRNSRRTFYLSSDDIASLRAAVVSGSDVAIRILLEQTGDVPQPADQRAGQAPAKTKDGVVDCLYAMTQADYACECYVDLTPAVLAGADTVRVPLDGVSFQYTEACGAVIAEQVAQAHTMLQSLDTQNGVVSKSDYASLQASIGSSFGIMVHPIVTNVAVLHGSVDLSQAPLTRKGEEIASYLRAAVYPLTDLFTMLRNGHNNIHGYVVTVSDFIKRTLNDVSLPPAQDTVLRRAELLQKYKKELSELLTEEGIEPVARDSAMQGVTRRFMGLLTAELPDDSITSLHAQLMQTAREALRGAQERRVSARELNEHGFALLFSGQRREAEIAETVFGAALVAERRSLSRGDHSPTLEDSVYGLLRSFVCTQNIFGIMRSLLRVFDIARLRRAKDNVIGTISSARLVLLSCFELIAAGEDAYFTLVLLYCAEDLFTFDLQSMLGRGLPIAGPHAAVEERVRCAVLLKVLCLELFKQLNMGAELSELRATLHKELRMLCAMQHAGGNESGGSPPHVFLNVPPDFDDTASEGYLTDEMLYISLRLALCEHAILEHSFAFARGILSTLEPEHISDGAQYSSIVTKRTLLLARCAIADGRVGDAKALLLREDLLTTIGGQASNATRMSLLTELANNTYADTTTSYLDIFDSSLDRSVPGLLAGLALVGSLNNTVPSSLMLQHTDLTRLLIDSSIAGDRTLAMDTSTASTASAPKADSGYLRSTGSGTPDVRQLRHLVPPTMFVSDELLLDLQNTSFNSVLFNSRVAFDMLVQAYLMSKLLASAQRSRILYYGGVFDCPVLTGFDMHADSHTILTLMRLCTRYVPPHDCIEFPTPFERPRADEYAVARKVFESMNKGIAPSAHADTERDSFACRTFTNDYLGDISPKSCGELIRLVDTAGKELIQRSRATVSERFCSPEIMGHHGITQLYLRQRQAIALFSTAAERENGCSIAWMGLALCLSHFLTDLSVIPPARQPSVPYTSRFQDEVDSVQLKGLRQKNVTVGSSPSISAQNTGAIEHAPNGSGGRAQGRCWLDTSVSPENNIDTVGLTLKAEHSLDALRLKIAECVDRMLSKQGANDDSPPRYAYMAIAQSVLNPESEEATVFSKVAMRLLSKVHIRRPLVPFVLNRHMSYPVNFRTGYSVLSLWFINRLRAVSLRSSATIQDVADSYRSALRGIGGILPGRNVEEIAERILLMMETSHSYELCGNTVEAERIMTNGLNTP